MKPRLNPHRRRACTDQWYSPDGA